MLKDKYIGTINQYIEMIPLKHTPDFVVDAKTKQKIESWYQVECDDHFPINTLFIGLDASFPASKPHIYAPELKEEYGVFPHLGCDCSLCYASEENTFLKSENPDSIIIETVAIVKELIKKLAHSFQKDKQYFLKEIYQELIFYFPDKYILSSINPYEQNIIFIHCLVNQDNQVVKLLTTKPVIKQKKITTRLAYFIPLKDHFIPIKFIQSGCSKETFFQLINKNPHLKGKNKKINNVDHFVLSFELDHYNIVLLYAHIDKNFVTFYTVLRADPNYYLKRSGAKLSKKHVLIVGCGSIGSHIATYLAKSGVSHITLCDYDIFSKVNISRHVLGLESVRKDKVTELQIYLQEHNIQISVHDFRELHTNIKEKTKVKSISYDKVTLMKKLNNYSYKKQFDVIILATGDQTFERNFHYAKKDLQVPIISTWVEPLNIGGHVLVRYKPQKGCYNCIIENSEKYTFTRGYIPETLSGCSGYFTDYNISSTVRTAELCTRIVLDICNNKYNHHDTNMIHSWKGKDEQANQYDLSINEAYKDNSYEALEQGRVLTGCTRCQEYMDIK